MSMVGEGIQHYQTAADIAKHLVQQLSRSALPAQTILNVNVPDLAMDQLLGIEVTRLENDTAQSQWFSSLIRHGAPCVLGWAAGA